MKLNTFIGATIVGRMFVGMAGAHPHNLKRAVVTEVAWTTVNVANVIVYVDDNGAAFETTTVENVETVQTTMTAPVSSATPTPTELIGLQAGQSNSKVTAAAKPAQVPDVQVVPPAPTESTSTTVESSAPPPPSPEPTTQAPGALSIVEQPPVSSAPPPPQPATTPPPEPQPEPQPEPTPEPTPEPKPIETSSDGRFPIGVTYDPFKPNACKTEREIRDEWSQMTKYGIVRVYGMGCGIIPLAVQLAHQNNQKIMAGIWMSDGSDNEDPQTVVQTLTNAIRNNADGDWSIISLVSVENERVNDKKFTASAIVDQINKVRSALRYAGYNGPVGAVETVPAMTGNPTICDNSDIALVNVHAFFDTNTAAQDAGEFVKNQVAMVKDKCNGKRVVVTESGWPHSGDSHGAAVASVSEQKKAVDSLLSTFDHDLFLFNAFDSMWKSDWASSFSAEKYWGIIGN